MNGTTRRTLLGLLGTGLLARPVRAQGRTVVDSAGRKVVVPERVNSVFAAGPPASVLIFSLAPELLAGWVRRPTAAEKDFLPKSVHDLPETGRLTGRGDTLSLERLVAAKPDLVLDFGSVTGTYISLADRVQEQTGIPYVLIDGTLANMPASLRLAGEIVGRAARGGHLADYAENTFAVVDDVLARVPANKRPRVYLARGPEGLETGGRGSINAEIIERVGGVNVAEGLGGRGNTANASLEQIIAWKPDVIVTLDRTFFQGVKRKPGWDQVRAVAEDKVYLSPSLPWGWIDAPPSINRLIGLRWLLAKFYPVEADIDLRVATEAFYSMFYLTWVSDDHFKRLIGGAG